MAKTDWKFNDVVTEADLNALGGEVNAASAHAATTSGAHGATSEASPGKLMQRDSAGRVKVAAPAAADDVARKAEVDAAIARADASTAPLAAELEDRIPTAVTLVPGVQTVQVPRPAPLRIKSIKGRTLVNLLGRVGNCEDLSKFAATGATVALSASDVYSGTTSLKVTANATTAFAYSTQQFSLIANRFYILVGMVKNGNAASGKVYLGGTSASKGDTIAATSTTSYTPVWRAYAPTSGVSGLTLQLAVTGANGQYVFGDAFRLYEITITEYAALDGMTANQIAAKYPYVDDFKNVNGIYIRQIAAQSADDQYIFYPDCQLAASTDGNVSDELYMDSDGRARVKRRFRSLELTGDMAWTFLGAATGYKTLLCKIHNPLKDTGQVVKYDGKLTTRINQGANPIGVDQHVITDESDPSNKSVVGLFVANIDSGWGDNYIPSTDEIKAYFNGWVMYDGSVGANYAPFNGSGSKWWAYRLSSWTPTNRSALGGGGENSVPSANVWGNGFAPYRLQYQLSTEVDEPLRSEGGILQLAGTNNVEVGCGGIVRELANIKMNTTNGFAEINSTGASGTSDSRLSFRSKKILSIFRNRTLDRNWIAHELADITDYGVDRAYIRLSEYETSAVYEVTYLALDTHLIGIPPAQISAEYTSNLRTITTDASKAAVQLARRVSVLENGSAQAKQPQWITPTLLNGWGPYSDQVYSTSYRTAQYRLNTDGSVSLRGVISGSTGTSTTALFILPPSCRPLYPETFIVPYSGSGVAYTNPGRVTIMPNGMVVIANDLTTHSQTAPFWLALFGVRIGGSQ